MIIYRAKLETRNFSFESFGSTQSIAITAMTNGMKKHAAQHRISEGQFLADYMDDVEIQPIFLGACYRDGGEL